MFHNIWGHDLTDNIRRMWFLKSDTFKREFKNCPLVYVPTNRGVLFEQDYNFHRLLEILGIDVNKFQLISQPTQFHKIILPDESFRVGGRSGYTTEYRDTIDQLKIFALKNRTPTSTKKIYYFHGGAQFGEEQIAGYFRSKGYEIICPETLTLDEQLNILINCESFASTVGSCSHNSLFLSDGTETILIPRSAKRYTSHQSIINQVYPLNVNYVDSTLSLFSSSTTNYYFMVSPQLKKFFGDKWIGYDEEDFKNFLQYVKDSLRKGRVINSDAMKYYAPVLEDFMAQLKQHEDLIASYNMPPNWETFQPPFSYQTHVHKKGWGDWKNENQISNDIEQKLDIQAIKINFPNHKVYYQVYYNAEEGWSEEVSNGQQAGTTGKTKAIYGVRIRLDEAGTKKSDILYRVHKFDGEWTDWAKNGEAIYSYEQKLNAIQIKLTQKEGI